MSHISNSIAKISVEKHDCKEQFLYDLDKTKSLCDIVRDICKKSGLPISSVYGLKLIRIKNDSAKPKIDTYISEKNLKNIQHNDCLKIVFSIEYLLKSRIIPHIDGPLSSLERIICYEDLTKLCLDPVFIEELVKSGAHHKLIETFINDNELRNEELCPLLATICHLLQKGFITDTSDNILDKTILLVKQNTQSESPDYIQYALAILQKILTQKDDVFLNWKEQIIKEVPIHCITPYIRNESPIAKHLQYGVLLLINTIVSLCKEEKRKHLVQEMNLAKNRGDIYKYIIEPAGDLDKNLEHELYVIQTYLLSLYNEALKSEFSLNDDTFDRGEFELEENDVRRLTILMDFDEGDLQKSTSSDTLFTNTSYKNERWSLASLMSEKSQSSRKSSVDFCSRSRIASLNIDCENSTISYLTLEALRHFKSNHKNNFFQSQIEEKVYEPGIFVTSQRVVKMLANLLDIGKDPPDSRSVFYQPIVFNTSRKEKFFFELFSRTMWLLSKTRREMKVSTIDDYPKVMNVLRKQLKMVLTTRPMDIKKLTDEMKETNYEAVMEQWQKEKEEELKYFLSNNQSMQELKQVYAAENELLVVQNRMNVLKSGDFFPKVMEKKTNGSIFVQLSKNERKLMVFDVADDLTKSLDLNEGINIADITHVALGLNCKHSHMCKSPSLAFSILINCNEKQLNFIAKDERMACYWTDAFHILTGNSRRSEIFKSELDVLVEMDLRLKILDLQNIPIPKIPPPIPKPPIPTKPVHLPASKKNRPV